MQSQSRFVDDLARVAGGALGALGSLKQEIEALVRQRMESFMADRDFVTREEFEVVKSMAAEARREQAELVKRIAALEKSATKDGGAKQTASRAEKSHTGKAATAKTSVHKSS